MVARPPRALGIDLGTTNTKVALVDFAGPMPTVRSLAAAPTPAPADLAPTLEALLRRVLADRPDAAPDAIGIASMAETGVPLDADGAPLGDWLRWDGHRAGREADELAAGLGHDHLVRATGVRPGAKVPLATWAWLRRHRSHVFAAMARWAGAADLACLLLTGRLATDHTLAGRTMAYRLADAGSPPPEAFDPDLAAAAGLRVDQLPDVVPAGIAATVRATGLPLRAGTPVTVAGHDHAVGAYAAGVRRPGQVADSVGTAEALLTVVATPPDPVAVAAAGMSSVVTVDGSARALLAGSPGAGGVVGWWLEHEAPEATAEQLFADVRTLGDQPSDVLVLPYLHGRQAPAPDPAARLRVVGPRAGRTDAELARAMVQGLCLQARWLLEEQARLAGGTEPAAEPVAVLGGPVLANPAWLRLKSLVTPQPLRLVTEAEAVAAGAAVVAAVRAGLVDAPSAVLAHRDLPRPAEHRDAYDRALADFVTAATETPTAEGVDG